MVSNTPPPKGGRRYYSNVPLASEPPPKVPDVDFGGVFADAKNIKMGSGNTRTYYPSYKVARLAQDAHHARRMK